MTRWVEIYQKILCTILIFLSLYLIMVYAKRSAQLLCSALACCTPFHLFVFGLLFFFFFFPDEMSISKMAISQRSTVTYGRAELIFSPITHTVTCFVCVHDLKVIAWPVLTRSLERWIKISYPQAVVSKADFHYLSSSWPPAPHTMLFLLSHTGSNTYTFIHLFLILKRINI